jgi:micrococcal nuclease
MKRMVPAICLICLLFACGVSYGKEYVVNKVIDGETFQLDTGEMVRYIGVEAPALNSKEGGSEFFAREAAKYNKRLVLLKKVRLEYDAEKKDARGRLLAYVFVKNVFINGELVRLGYARAAVKPPNTKYKELLLNYQHKAMEEEKGLWQEKKGDSEKYYIGNKRTYVFHRPSCKSVAKISEKNRIVFRNRLDAIKIGYVPDKLCKP